MGIFDIFKKKADAPADAPAQAPMEAAAGEEMKHCEKCGKDFPMSEGNMVLEGSAFCCNSCCPKDKKDGEDHEVCEFC